MKKLFPVFIILSLIVISIYMVNDPLMGTTFLKSPVSPYEAVMKQDLLCLMLAYPEHITGLEQSAGQVYIIMKSGEKILYDDKKQKSVQSKIAYPDIQDMMEQPYPLKPLAELMEQDYDPGRARVYSLLGEVYGSSRQQIEKRLVNTRIGYGTVQFNGSNNAAEALKKSMEELHVLSKSRQDIRRCIYPCSGTYNYRVISGTGRLSPHAYGIAIDLARDKRDYWQWASRAEGGKRLAAYPKEIVEVFEKNNFIWGGKWGHFDILHFEYRPEIVIKARCFGGGWKAGTAWYAGVPAGDEYARECIKKIDAAIK